MKRFAAVTAAMLFAVPALAQQTITPETTAGVYMSAADVAAAVARLPKDPLGSGPVFKMGPYNVNVNSVCPGMVDGPRFRKVCEEMSKRLGITAEEAMRKHAEEYALKRVSTDRDVANAVLFFSSDASRQITGQDLAVEGGWVI